MISKLIATLQKYCNIGAKGEKKETIWLSINFYAGPKVFMMNEGTYWKRSPQVEWMWPQERRFWL
jgi:hypothetical protein